MHRRLIDRRDGLCIRLAVSRNASSIDHRKNESIDTREPESMIRGHQRMKSTDAIFKSLLSDTNSVSKASDPKKFKIIKDEHVHMTKKVFNMLDKVQSNNAKFLQTVLHGRHKSIAEATSADIKHRQTASSVHQFMPAAEHTRKKSLPRINLASPKTKLTYNEISLYQLPNKDVYIQQKINKRDGSMMTNFKQMVDMKAERTAALVNAEIDSIKSLKGKTILKVKLAVVHLTGQMVYLERIFTIKAIIDSYLDIYFKTDKYSFGFSGQSNKMLVRRIVSFIENVNCKILVLKCRDDTELLQKFMNLQEFVRYDCDNSPDVHILDVGESKLIDRMFFYFCPVFYGRQKQNPIQYEGFNVKDSMIEMPDIENLSEDNTPNNLNKESHKFIAVDNKSKWMAIIEKCLTKKNILTMKNDEFDNIFADYLNCQRKLEPATEAVTDQSSLGHVKRFRQLLVDQIQRDRDERITRKIKVDYDEYNGEE